METSKGIKILRIVSLTLGIISMLFFLYTKIAHAESQQVPFPTDNPLQPSWDFSPFKDNTTAQNNLVNGVKQALIDKGYNNNPDFMITFVNYNTSNNIYECRIYFNAGRNGNMYEYGTYLLYDWLTNESSRYGIIACYGTIYCTTDGQIYSNSIPTAPNTNSYNNGFTSNINGISLKIGDVNGRNYPVYSSAYVYDITGNDLNNNTGIITVAQSGASTVEIIEAQITEIFENTELIAQAGSQTTDTLDTLKQSTLKGWLQTIVDSIWKSANNKVQNLTSFFSPTFQFWSSIWSHIKDKIDGIKDDFESLLEKVETIVDILQEYVANDLTAGGIAQVWQTNFQASYVYTLITTGNSIKTALSSLGNTNATEPIITVNLGNNTFFGQTGEYIFRFGWYENIRTAVVTFITAFWIVGLGIHLFTQIPNMIHGVSGTAHGIQNASGTAIHKQ